MITALAAAAAVTASTGCRRTDPAEPPGTKIVAPVNGGPASTAPALGAGIAASVNGDPILFDELYAQLNAQYGREALDHLIEGRLVRQAGKAAGITISDADLTARLAKVKRGYESEAQFNAALEQHGETRAQFEEGIVFDETLRRLLTQDVPVDDATLKRYFDEHRASFDHREIHHRHILSRTKEEANAIKAQLDGGADFAQLARERSNDAHSFQKGGDMETWPLERTPDRYRLVVSSLKPGKISAPFRSYLGWDVAAVLEIKGTLDFDAQKDEVKEGYLQEVVAQRRDPWLAEQRKRSGALVQGARADKGAAAQTQIVAWVRDEPITKDELYEAMMAHYGARALGRLIDARLVSQLARASGVTVSAAEIDAEVDRAVRYGGVKPIVEAGGPVLAAFRADKATDVAVRKILTRDVPQDDAALRRFLDEDRDRIEWREVHSRHILCRSEGDAKAVAAQLKAGADFATLARQRSIDANTYAKGGDLGWAGRGETPAQYEHVLFALQKGETSAPIRSLLGWHIGQVIDIRGVMNLDTTRDRIVELYLDHVTQSKYGAWFAEQKRQAKIVSSLRIAAP
jgi:foldase protein PrsA